MTLIDNGDGTGVLQIAPGAGDRGDYVIGVVASDDGDGTDDVLAGGFFFNISVESPNEAPIIAHLGPVVAVVGQALDVLVDVETWMRMR